ncbi:MAG: nitrilase-related carbon-nitrogen hydrolase, partial [Longimicrobiales bacterium]
HAPRLGDPDANIASIAVAARTANADILLTPELSVTGYDVRDAAAALALPLDSWPPAFEPLTDAPGMVVTGVIESDGNGLVYNAAIALQQGRVKHVHRKIYLPTYGMFDEMRYFARGRTVEPMAYHGWRVGILVCEDFWHPGLIYTLASAGIDLLLVMAAGAGRGVWEGGSHGDFASTEAWTRIAETTAQQYGMYVALANRVGVEGAVTFAGGSLIVGPTGEVLARGPSHEEAILHATLSRASLLRARRPYFHGRDDEPSIVIRELTRLTQHG